MKTKDEIKDFAVRTYDQRNMKARNDLISTIDRAYRAGYEAGKAESVEEAYQRGYKDGYDQCKHNDVEQEEWERKGYQRGYAQAIADGKVDPADDLYNNGYQKGLDDAWEAAKKIVFPEEHYGSVPISWFIPLFDESSIIGVMERHTAKEVIDKLREYEQKKSVKTNWDVFKDIFGEHAHLINWISWWDEPYKEPESEGEDDRS